MTGLKATRGVMDSVTAHVSLCKTGLLRAPDVLGTRAGIAQWARLSWRFWIVLAVGGLVAAWLLPALAAQLVDLFYPLGKQDFGKSVAGFFDGSTVKLKTLRSERYTQFLWGGYAIVAVYVVSEALRSFAERTPPDAAGRPVGDDAADDAVATQVLPRLAAAETTQVLPRFGAAEVTQVMPRAEPVGSGPRADIADGRYRLDAVMGKGGAGQVYRAFDTRLHRAVAVKQLLVHDAGEDDFVRRFEQEARTLANLSHPHIVAVHDLVVEHGQFWMVMELLTGGDLKGLIRERHFLLQRDALSITRDIAAALAHAHEKQVVHRDIKPENVLRSAEGVWKLTDFGIAKQQSSDIKTQFGLVIGSLAYMSPEQATGAVVDARSDIYSLGISLHEMLTGEAPFKGDMRQVLAQHVTRDLPVLDHVSPAVNALLRRMTAKAPEERFADCGELIRAMDDCLAEVQTAGG